LSITFRPTLKRADKRLYDKNIEDKKPIGFIIAFSFGKGALEEVARLKIKENIVIELVTVDKIVPIAKKPTVTVEVKEISRDEKGNCEIEFIAVGKSEAGIEFYSWNFNYDAEQGFKADVLLDKEGKQVVKFKAGVHNIAVKVVDNDGLENIEVIKLTVNGKVKRE
jgi:site-specific DNA-methyltransferase (adenine-specific)